MIFSTIIRSYKSYSRFSYVPISNGNLFTAFVGENGIGKSSIIEALDTYFNKTQGDWNFNHSVHAKGVQSREPVICPIFLISRKKVRSNTNVYKYLDIISDITWQLEYDDFNSAQHKISKEFCNHRDRFLGEEPKAPDDYFLVPLGLKVESLRPKNITKTMGIFDSITDYKERAEEHNFSLDDILNELTSFITGLYTFIYIPSDINFEEYTKIESKTIQSLMGKTVDDLIKDSFDNAFISDINRNLDAFIKEISDKLEKYEYKKPGKKQTLFNSSHLTSKIIETYFESKILNLKTSNDLTPISNCSSGEKRMALIDLSKAFLQSTSKDAHQEVILAIDEPEISLHTSTCFDQFEKLRDISENSVQTLLTTHWYGFMPIISEGSAIYVAERESEKICSMIDLRCFKDELKRLKASSRGELPKEIELKSNNDLVQSIVASITSKDCNWVICEGSSDKIYLGKYINRKSTYVLPIGKSSNVKKLYRYLYLALSEEQQSIKGKVYMLLDTDAAFERFDKGGTLKNIEIKRLQNNLNDRKTTLLNTTDNNYNPPTEIEDSLVPQPFLDALDFFYHNGYAEHLDRLKKSMELIYPESSSGIAFDLRDSEKRELNNFFDLPGMKIKFALKYCEFANADEPPEWIQEILKFLSK